MEEEFCIEVCDEAFNLIHDLLRQVLEVKASIDLNMRYFATSLIKVAEVNLHRLVKSNIDPIRGYYSE